jgi:hypothetical protein
MQNGHAALFCGSRAPGLDMNGDSKHHRVCPLAVMPLAALERRDARLGDSA